MVGRGALLDRSCQQDSESLCPRASSQQESSAACPGAGRGRNLPHRLQQPGCGNTVQKGSPADHLQKVCSFFSTGHWLGNVRGTGLEKIALSAGASPYATEAGNLPDYAEKHEARLKGRASHNHERLA